MLEQVTIKEMTSPEEVVEIQQLIAKIWGSQAIPTHQLVAAIKNGGLVLGAYLDGKIVGFNYCFIGTSDGQVYLHSHMLGVEKIYREQGIGELLKHAQQEFAKEYNIQLVRWLFDPLETRTANLYFTKLGAVSHSYQNDYYGHLEDDFNEGLPSDRVGVEWWIQRNLVTDCIDELEEEARELVPWSLTAAGLPAIDQEGIFNREQAFYDDAYLLAIPQYFQKLKVESPKLAEDWRYKIRTMLTTL
ncbi:MAG: GNAT family N-acetyltransferase, partial [Lysinibacillus sp.]